LLLLKQTPVALQCSRPTSAAAPSPWWTERGEAIASPREPGHPALTPRRAPRLLAPVPLLPPLDDEHVVPGELGPVLLVGGAALLVRLGDARVALALLAPELLADGEPIDLALERSAFLHHDPHLRLRVAVLEQAEQLRYLHLRMSLLAPPRLGVCAGRSVRLTLAR
jgi:hypothetical protein